MGRMYGAMRMLEVVAVDTDGNERRDHRLTFLGELPPAE